jgi:hypothetical protein
MFIRRQSVTSRKTLSFYTPAVETSDIVDGVKSFMYKITFIALMYFGGL